MDLVTNDRRIEVVPEQASLESIQLQRSSGILLWRQPFRFRDNRAKIVT
jgi:hypothetical protein